MTDHELALALKDKSALIVHFSHHSLMRSGRPVYPDDLKRVFARHHEFPLSCSAVSPGHRMSPVGSVGVIFAPTAGSVLSVSNDDSGSLTWKDGSEGSAGIGLSPEAFSDSFNVVSGRYNEWRVQGAPILGIFVADPNNIQVKRLQEVQGEDAIYTVVGLDHISLDEVAATFPGQPVFTMCESGPVRLL